MATTTAAAVAAATSTAAAAIDPARAAESNMPRIIGVCGVFWILGLIVVSLRLYARFRLVRSPGWDDAAIVCSAICGTGGYIIMLIQIPYGLGHHQDTIPIADLTKLNHAGFWSSIISANAAFAFLKISIALNLLRLSMNKWYKWTLWVVMACVGLMAIEGWLTFFLHCKPMSGHWDKSVKPKCYSLDLFIKFSLVNTIYNIVTDVLFATIPIPIIWTLQMKRKTRLYVIGILSLGYVAVAMGIVKGVYQQGYGSEPDKTFEHNIFFWGFVQLQTGILAACAPTLKPIFGKLLKLTSHDGYDPSKLYENRTGGRTNRSKNNTLLSISHMKHSDHIELKDQDNTSLSDHADYMSHLRATEAHQKTHMHSKSPTSTSFYKGDDDGSGSEDMILDQSRRRPRAPETVHVGGVTMQMQSTAQAQQGGFERGSAIYGSHGSNGIVRTTEITVK